MSLQGYTIPRTAEGRVEPRAAAPVALRRQLPGGRLLGRSGRGHRRCCRRASSRIADPGRCSAVVAEWQGFSETGDELVDPSRSQYREAYVVVNAHARRRGGHDLPVLLGRPGLRPRPRLDPGVPEEARLGLADAHASAWTRGPIPGIKPGARYGGTCSTYGRRVLEMTVTLERESAERARPQRAADRQRAPLPAARGGPPRRAGGARARADEEPGSLDVGGVGGLGDALVHSTRRTRSSTRSGRPEIAKGYRFTFAYTVDDLETVKEL